MEKKRARSLDKISRNIYPLRILGFLLFSISYLLSQSKLGLSIDLWGAAGIGICLVYPHIIYVRYLKNRKRKTELNHMVVDMGLQGAMTALVNFNPSVFPYLIANAAANYALGGIKQSLKAVIFAIAVAIVIGVLRNEGVVLQVEPIELLGPYIYLIVVALFMGHLANERGYMGYQDYVRGIAHLRRRKAAEVLAQVDFLTGLNNRRSMFNQAELNDKNLQVGNDDTTLAMIDLDHFKQVNDQHGHDHGDEVLVKISKLLKSSLRETDFVARWGGEEFLVLMPKTSLEKGLNVAETIRQNIANCSINYGGIDHHVTATLGVASYGVNSSFEETINRADKALFKGKQQGRNRVVQVSKSLE